jgi:hypothetical protein
MSPAGARMPRPSEAPVSAVRSLVPDDPAVAVRPMFGRAMRGYVVLPGGWNRRAAAKRWIAASLEWTRAMPPKRGGRGWKPAVLARSGGAELL